MELRVDREIYSDHHDASALTAIILSNADQHLGWTLCGVTTECDDSEDTPRRVRGVKLTFPDLNPILTPPEPAPGSSVGQWSVGRTKCSNLVATGSIARAVRRNISVLARPGPTVSAILGSLSSFPLWGFRNSLDLSD